MIVQGVGYLCPNNALVPPAHLEGLFQAGAWYEGSTSTAMVKEI